jgi:para-nitrobenzyl esterase
VYFLGHSQKISNNNNTAATMKIPFLPAISCALFAISGCLPASGPSVTAPAGVIQGNAETDHDAFLGIPYAKPPSGALRWQAPQPLPPFAQPFRATRAGKGCYQFAQLTTVTRESEDCLFLNIWRPNGLPSGAGLPVEVFIHGGSLALGAGSEAQYDGATLAATRNVIVVTLNYRLGYLGHLSLPQLTAEAGHSGNYAYLDQQLALKWVHENIAAFGGDPGRVMLFGESAGASSTCVQLAAPGSRDYFQSAALESGACSRTVRTQSDAEQKGVDFAALVGCENDALNCLREKSVADIDAALEAAGYTNGPFGASSALPLGVIVDNQFLDQQPRDAIGAGSAAGKSVVIGINKDESTIFAAFSPNVDSEAQYLAELAAQYGSAAADVAALYPYGNFANGSTALAAIRTDRGSVCPSRISANDFANGGASVYFYHFTQNVEAPLPAALALLTGSDIVFGTFHSSEIPYVFGVESIMGNLQGTRADTSALMQQYWRNNAAQGNPNGAGLPVWPVYTVASPSYLELDETPQAMTDLKAQQCALWAGLGL